MNIKLAENIKAFRKEKRMTQEQLAEALGVTVGAVYKWEKNVSVPDIVLILEMADLFGTSTDVLLGYEWKQKNIDEVVESIKVLLNEKKYAEAVTEAEKSLKKFPNNFKLVYQSAIAYSEMSGSLYLNNGDTPEQEKAHQRGIELFEHACELLPQNTDEAISEVSIRRCIAQLHTNCMYIYRAIDVLKKHNVCGINNAMIGMLYGDCLHEDDEAEKYLGKAFGTIMDDINAIIIGFTNIFFHRKDYDSAIDCVHWLRITLRGIQPEEELTWFDRYDCLLIAIIAECYCFKGDFEKAKHYNKQALLKAIRFDSAQPEEIQPMKLYTALNIENLPTYGAQGKTALERLENRFFPDDEAPRNWEIWQEVKKEVFGNEAV